MGLQHLNLKQNLFEKSFTRDKTIKFNQHKWNMLLDVEVIYYNYRPQLSYSFHTMVLLFSFLFLFFKQSSIILISVDNLNSIIQHIFPILLKNGISKFNATGCLTLFLFIKYSSSTCPSQ